MHAVLWIFSTLLSCVIATNNKKVVCYWGSWSIYAKGFSNFNTSNIDPKLCTHLLYGFVGLGFNGTLKINGKPDLSDDGRHNGYNLFNQLRNKNLSLKTMISIGGWGEGSVNFSRMVTDSKLRKHFVQNALDFVTKYKFDGLDFDWEYPSQRGGAASDKENFVLLLKELREAFDKQGLLLSAAVSRIPTSVNKSYNISGIVKYVDFINLMAYNFHGTWENVADNNSPLYAGSWEKGKYLFYNVNSSVHYWLSQGTPAEKLILGIPFFGHGYILANVSNTGIGAPTLGRGWSVSYMMICNSTGTEKWITRFSKEQRVPYAFKGNQWISYDNIESVREKAEYIKKLNLGGAMIWSIEKDDFRGICGEKYPLLKTLNQVLLSTP